MKQTVVGYEPTEVIYEGACSRIYRTQSTSRKPPAVLKILDLERASNEDIVQVRHEYEIGQELDGRGVARIYGLESLGSSLVLIVEDIGADSLARWLSSHRPSVVQCLEIAIKSCECLSLLHRLDIIHRDFNPSNLLWNPDTGVVKLIDLGIAARFIEHNSSLMPPSVLEGTLAYISPEQTMRMNRTLDHRSDLYSLGVTLYQMSTGRLPFEVDDPMELVHCHLARTPRLPSEVSPSIPVPLSKIIMKLLAKDPEERYQGVDGVKADLSRVQSQLERQGVITSFVLGQEDLSERLHISQRLYGRKREIELMLGAFERVAEGACEVLTLSGYSGIGKSALVHEVHKTLASKRGFFVTGKFDQLNRAIPYSGLALALRDLVRQLLGSPSGRVEQWRERLRACLGDLGGVLVDVVPELEHLIGRMPSVLPLGPAEEQNRFNLVFGSFMRTVLDPGQPLVIFLDDLQWIDNGSLTLLEALMSDQQSHHVLLIGAFRDNEVSPAHPLMMTLEKLSELGVVMRDIALGPLSQRDVESFISDSLRHTLDDVAELAEWVTRKTGGNPFFCIQFLRSLHAKHMLYCDGTTGEETGRRRGWRWDIDAIRTMEQTDNVVDLLVNRLRELPSDTQEVLTIAACIGNSFFLKWLAAVHGKSPLATFDCLQPALRQGLILNAARRDMLEPDDLTSSLIVPQFRFLHDRVQQGAYALAPEEDRPAIRLKIGRLLLAKASTEDLEEKLFEIASHFTECLHLITGKDERRQIAALCVRAGERARASVAYVTSVRFFESARSLLGDDAWLDDYELSFSTYVGLAESEYLCGNFDRAELVFMDVMENARSRLERARIFDLRMKLYQVAGDYEGGLELGLEALTLYGIELPGNDELMEQEAHEGFEKARAHFADRPIASLLDVSPIDDPDKRMIVDLLVGSLPCSYIGRPKTFPWLEMQAINHALEYGNTESSCFAYSAFGIVLISLFGDSKSAYEFSRVSLALNEAFDDTALRGTLLHLHGDHFNYWSNHVSTGFPFLERGFKACLEVGDLVYAGFIAFEIVWQHLEKGDPLEHVLQVSETYAAFARQTKNLAVLETIRMQQQLIANFQGKTVSPTSLSSDDFDEQVNFEAVTGASFGCGIAFFHIMKTILHYHAGEFDAALEASERAHESIGAVSAMPIEATYSYYRGLLHSALAMASDGDDRVAHRLSLDESLKRLTNWALYCPENFETKRCLLAAQAARLDERPLDAMRLFDQAIGTARSNGFPWFEAVAAEHAAVFHEELQADEHSRLCLQNALRSYQRWGAVRLAEQIKADRPRVSEGLERSRALEVKAATSEESSRSVHDLDLEALLKAQRSISGEILLDRLVNTLMRLIIESAGAQRGVLFLDDDGDLTVVAESIASEKHTELGLRESLNDSCRVPSAIINFVKSTGETMVIDEAAEDLRFGIAEASNGTMVRSVLCLPVRKGNRSIAIVYLENNLASHAFTKNHVRVLEALAVQAAISLENARFYQALEREVVTRKEVERELRNNQRLLDSIVDAAPAAIYIKDLDGAYLLANRWFEDYSGMERSLMLGRRDRDIFPAEAVEFFCVNDARVIESGEALSVEEDLEFPDGQHTFLSVKFPVLDTTGKLFAVGGFSMDITELKRLQEEVSQTHKLEAIGQLAGGVAHDFNNLLTAIAGNAELLVMSLNEGSSEARCAREIDDAAQRAGELTQQLLDFSRKGKRQDLLVNVHDVLRGAANLLRRSIDKRIEIKMNFASQRATVQGDAMQLQNAFLNLGVNARDAMPKGGELSFSTRFLPAETPETSSCFEPARLEITVADTGIGMDEDVRSRIFDPYFTTKELGKGTGLGLAGVFGCVSSHEGEITVDSHLGNGSSFRIVLPLAEEETTGTESRRSKPSSSGGGRILVVDDEELVRNLTSRALEKFGYETIACEDGPSALEVIRQEPSAIDLVILDLIMPKMSGEETFQELMRIDSTVPILIASGYSQAKAAQVLLAAGAVELLNKPFRISELMRAVAKHKRSLLSG